MLKHLLFYTFLFVGFAYAAAQNLVPDSSFENNSLIPVDFSAINASYTWNMPGMGTTDLFCTCDKKRKKISLVDVPQNPMGYQEAHSGTCYAGLFAFSHGDYREYLQSPLKTPLEKNKTYLFSMYISLADYSRTCLDQFGVCFLAAKAHYKTTEVITDLQPVYINIEKEPGKDVKRWHRVTVTYTAQGGERYLLIGGFELHTIKKTKFKAPKEIHSRINQSTERDAYYYIDDVSLVETLMIPFTHTNEKPKSGTQPSAGLVQDNLLTFKTIVFQSNSAVLLPASDAELDVLADYLAKNPRLQLELIGNTDNSGNETTNKQLSIDRAGAVSAYLLTKGIEKKRITAKGYGSEKPVATNDTEEGRQKNRRVEFRITEK